MCLSKYARECAADSRLFCRSDSISCGVKGPGMKESASFGLGEGGVFAAVEVLFVEELTQRFYPEAPFQRNARFPGQQGLRI